MTRIDKFCGYKSQNLLCCTGKNKSVSPGNGGTFFSVFIRFKAEKSRKHRKPVPAAGTMLNMVKVFKMTPKTGKNSGVIHAY